MDRTTLAKLMPGCELYKCFAPDQNGLKAKPREELESIRRALSVNLKQRRLADGQDGLLLEDPAIVATEASQTDLPCCVRMDPRRARPVC